MNTTITKPIFWNLISRCFFALWLLLLVGCGGGGSSTGGSSNVFLGKQEVRTTQFRITSEPRSTDFQLIRGQNQITISDQRFSISVQLSGSNFTVTSPEIPILEPGSPCSSFSVTYSGTITDSIAVGTIRGNYNCILPATINGAFEASNRGGTSLPTLPSVYTIVVGTG